MASATFTAITKRKKQTNIFNNCFRGRALSRQENFNGSRRAVQKYSLPQIFFPKGSGVLFSFVATHCCQMTPK